VGFTNQNQKKSLQIQVSFVKLGIGFFDVEVEVWAYNLATNG
jgi:hypothetical protein